MVEETSGKLTGTDRAAVFLLSLGEDKAAEVMRHIVPKEVQKVGAAMAQMTNISRGQVETVFGDFTETVGTQTSLGVGSDEYIRKVMVDALGEDKASNMIDRILLGRNTKGLDN